MIVKQRTLKLGDRVIYCYEDGSVEFLSDAQRHRSIPLVRTKGYDGGNGYKYIKIVVNGKLKNLRVHRLIASAFHPNPEDFPEVDHINRDKTDNRPCNLRWVNHRINEDNKDCVDKSLAKYGVRHCDNKNAYNHVYNKAHRKTTLNMIKPNGRLTSIRTLSPEQYDILKPLSL